MAATAAKKKPHKAWSPAAISVELTDEKAELLLKLLPKDDPLAKDIREKLHPKTVTVCAECGSPHIQLEAWIHWNGGSDGGGDPPGGTYCGECGENDIEWKEVDARWVDDPDERSRPVDDERAAQDSGYAPEQR